jgi:hypothetical protein
MHDVVVEPKARLTFAHFETVRHARPKRDARLAQVSPEWQAEADCATPLVPAT